MHPFHEFPKWKYHAEKEAKIVESREAEEGLGLGWVDSPAELQDDWSPNEAIPSISPASRAPIKKVIRRAKA